MRPYTLGMAGQGYKVAGERNGMHKLTAVIVRYARKHARHGAEALAAQYGVDESTMRRAIQRRTWRRA